MLTCVVSHFSRVQLFATLWTIASKAPLPMGFFRHDYWSGLPCPHPGDLLGVSEVSCNGRQVLYHKRHWGSSTKKAYRHLNPRYLNLLTKLILSVPPESD